MRAVRRTSRRTAAAALVTAAATVATTGFAVGGGAGATANPDPRANTHAGADAGVRAGTSVRSGTVGRSYWLRAQAQFAPPTAVIRPDAVTYRQDLVPAASRIGVLQTITPTGMGVRVAVDGLQPGHTFGVHVHTEPCGAKPDDSGPHYQDEKDPVQPSTDPAYANPGNEIWLDLKTDAGGRGSAVARHDWSFRNGEARSVVVHEHATHTGHGEAGQAGDRVACFSVPFGGKSEGGTAGSTAHNA